MEICHTILPLCQHKHEITWLSCNHPWPTGKQKQSHVATPRSHVFDSHVSIKEWQHGKKSYNIRHNILDGFLESKCVYFLFLFSVLFCLFFFFFFFSGEGWGTIFPQLCKSMEPGRWRYYWTDFSPHASLGSWIPESGFQGLEFPDSFGVYSRFQSPRFWIPRAKISRIPETDSLVELDFGLTIC